MQPLFFKPSDGWVGDCIPYHDGKTFRVFYLKTRREGEPFSDIAWHQVSTDDFLTFRHPRATGIAGGTGSILRAFGQYHMFYCDNSDPSAQYVCHAVSGDLDFWTPLPEHTFGADDVIYERKNFRDPHVFWNEEAGAYWMLLAARAKGGTNRCGCTGLCTSTDLVHWTFEQPFYAPGIDVGAHECPDIFKLGDWWYLTYSTYTGFYATVYRMSRSLLGPWLIPERETLDGRAYYAGKTAIADGKVYLLGWNPTREAPYYADWNPSGYEGNDYNVFDWAGNLVVHELKQQPDGALGVSPPQTIADAFEIDSPLAPRALQGAWGEKDGVFEAKGPGFDMLDLGALPPACRLDFTLRFGASARRMGIALRTDGRAEEGYYFTFDRAYQRLSFASPRMQTDEGWRVIPYTTELEQPLSLEPGRDYRVTLFVDGSMAVAYVNGEIALNARMYDRRAGGVALFAIGGEAWFSDVTCALRDGEEGRGLR
jgi:beta-fructofuranosidase